MSLRKFISGVIAFAVAATAFAAMAVTASAKNYTDISVTPNTQGKLYRVADNGNGTFKTTNNSSSGYSGVIADLSGLTDIADATSVTVEFDTYVIASSSGKTPILVYGVGDKAERDLTANGSGAGNYKTAGLITYFGSTNGTTYTVYGNSNNYASTVANNDVHAKVTLDRVADTYKCVLTCGSKTVETSGETTVDNLTVIEAITWGAAAYNITFNNIKVSYTVPDVIATLEDSEAFTINNGYDDNVVVGIFDLYVLADSYNLSNVKYKSQAGKITGTNTQLADGSGAQIAVVINGATDKAVLKNVEFN